MPLPEDVVELVVPGEEHRPGYVAALERGWAADRDRPVQWIENELAEIAKGEAQFLAFQDDPEAKGPAVTLPDSTKVPRLPGYRRWLWDGEFCGLIGLRWQPGTTALPPHCLGHIGYAVVPWKQKRGYATLALRLLLPQVKAEGLPFVEITTDPENIPSQR